MYPQHLKHFTEPQNVRDWKGPLWVFLPLVICWNLLSATEELQFFLKEICHFTLSQCITSETGSASDEILFSVVFLLLVLHGIHKNTTTFD